jgi:hypothetical protein
VSFPDKIRLNGRLAQQFFSSFKKGLILAARRNPKIFGFRRANIFLPIDAAAAYPANFFCRLIISGDLRRSREIQFIYVFIDCVILRRENKLFLARGESVGRAG